jgi:hypothetical protein
MALVLLDRVRETSTTTGTGTITLLGATMGYQAFSVIGNGNATYYTIYDSASGDWEVGIGTYTSSGTTLSRTTVLSSSNGGALVPFAAGTKDVFVTYPAERSVYRDTANTYTVQQAFDALTANSIALTSGTITATPVNNTDIVNKQYADAIASGIHFHEAVGYATTAALPACTYNNGVSGVGATLTANANGALTVDSYTFTSPADNGTRILIKNQVNGAENGVYTLTQAGNSSPGAPFILTRATDFDSVGTGVDQIDEGDFFLVTSGTVNLNTAWVQQTSPPITIGTTAIVFQQFSAPITYTAGTGLSESPAYTFNIANTGVTAATYGSASQVPVFAVNAQGQLTTVTNTAIAIAAGAVSGLAASATTDTTDATNITSGTLPSGRLIGGYGQVTGVGTLTTGTWNASTITVAYGGTNITTYATGDLIYASATNTLSKLSAGTNGQVLTLSGGVPTWQSTASTGVTSFETSLNGLTPSTATTGAVTLAGTLGVQSGGTGATTLTGYVKGTGTSALTASSTIPISDLTGTLAVANGGTGQTSYTDGQLLIGNSTGNTLTKTTLTAGSNITITNGAGSITIASTGGGSTANPEASNGIFVNSNTVSTSYTIASGFNGLTSGPITINNGVTVTIANGSRWAVVQ